MTLGIYPHGGLEFSISHRIFLWQNGMGWVYVVSKMGNTMGLSDFIFISRLLRWDVSKGKLSLSPLFYTLSDSTFIAKGHGKIESYEICGRRQ